MPFPTISDLAERLYDQAVKLQDPRADEAAGWPLAKLCGALLDDLDWVRDALSPTGTDPAGGDLLHPDRAPAGWVRWLAQFAGVRVTQGAAVAVQRDEARTAAGRKRGRTTSMVADVQRTLTGTKFVGVVQFVDGNRWRAAFRTLPAETPDSAATLRAAMGQKPYGIVLTHVVDDSPIWDEAGVAWGDVDNAVTWNGVTLEDVEA